MGTIYRLEIFERRGQMTKVVINRCFGGFGLSESALKNFALKKGYSLNKKHKYTLIETHEGLITDNDIPRDDAELVATVEKLGEDSWGPYAELLIVEVPDDVEWYIEEYDGQEWIAERHRTWP